MLFLVVLVCLMNWRQLTLHQTLGLTTSVALLIVGFAGVLSGQGQTHRYGSLKVVAILLRNSGVLKLSSSSPSVFTMPGLIAAG
jgi:uncharacterized membrane protein (DUF4010 family)